MTGLNKIIELIFSGLNTAFDKIPLLNKIKGLRSIIGFVGAGVTKALLAAGVGDASYMDMIFAGFVGFTALALNAKGRPKLK